MKGGFCMGNTNGGVFFDVGNNHRNCGYCGYGNQYYCNCNQYPAKPKGYISNQKATAILHQVIGCFLSNYKQKGDRCCTGSTFV